MSCSVCLYAKTNGQISILSDLNYEMPHSNQLLVSGNTTTIDKEQCSYDKDKALGALEGDFDLGYKRVFDFLDKCLQSKVLDEETHNQLSIDTHQALDKFLDQGTKVYLEVISDGENLDEDEDMCSLLHEEINHTVENIDDIIAQLLTLIEESGSDDLLKAIGYQWSN